jgi:hypothetical protein
LPGGLVSPTVTTTTPTGNMIPMISPQQLTMIMTPNGPMYVVNNNKNINNNIQQQQVQQQQPIQHQQQQQQPNPGVLPSNFQHQFVNTNPQFNTSGNNINNNTNGFVQLPMGGGGQVVQMF